MRRRYILIVVVLLTVAFGVGRLSAGTPDSPAGPTDAGAQMYTLEQIYNRINDGTAATKMTQFTEPAAGPGTGTMHTLDEIYNLIGQRAPVPKTGQTTLYATGDDGDLEKGVAWPSPRFTDNGNGTVTDNLTGLMWMKNADAGNDCDGADTEKQTWAEALASCAQCNTNTFAGYTDWRLPNVRELFSLIDFSQFVPALPSGYATYFTGVQSDRYWSSTTLADYTVHAWHVNLNVGFVVNDPKAHTYYVWPVRGGQ